MSKRKSVMKHQFSEVPKAEIQRSSFDRSSGHKTAFDSDYLYPIFVDEALPGDTFNLSMTALARLATPIFPLMDNMTMSTFFFFCPNRLIWDNWEKFNGEQKSPGASTDYVMPTMLSPVTTGHLEESLSDYMGIPTKIPDLKHSCLWHRAYNLAWDQWFRDENLQDPPALTNNDGPDSDSDYILQKRGKRHDYFTSGLPWPQKDNGKPVLLPLGTAAPVIGDGTSLRLLSETTSTSQFVNADASTATPPNNLVVAPGGLASPERLRVGTNSGMIADLTNATAATINELRQAFAVQRLFERDARGGTRYTEIIKSHFQVTSPDARLQRVEYLGGGTSPVNISPIAQTQATSSGVTPQANLAAIGTAQLHNHGFTKSFTEHGVIIGLVCVTADITYQNGLNRMFSRETRFDHYWPALSHIGEQAVKNKEIWATGSGNPAQDEATFAYQERYAEYRYKPSIITGRFRSNATTPLDAWHLSEKFTALPVLNAAFITSNTPVDRVVAVTTEPEFIFDSYIKLRCARPMPVYGVPGMIDHF